MDFNLTANHRLTLRHNYVDGVNDLYGTSNSSTTFNYPDHLYQFNSETNSTVAQLNSTFGAAFNELRLTYQRIREARGFPSPFPQVQVDLADGTRLLAGTEQFSAANALDQDIFELTDDFTFTRGNHTITVGTHNEFFKFRNLFIRDNFGTYRFSSLDNFEAGLAQQYDYSFSATADPQQAAEFKVNQLGLYVGDVWRVNPQLTLTLGVRLDKPFFPDKPTANPVVGGGLRLRHGRGAQPDACSRPEPASTGTSRATASGRCAAARASSRAAPRTSGFRTSMATPGSSSRASEPASTPHNRIPFVTDPFNQPKTVTGAAAGTFTNEIDLIDPDYKYPEVLRGNLAYDHDLGVWELIGTVELFGATTLDGHRLQQPQPHPGADDAVRRAAHLRAQGPDA